MAITEGLRKSQSMFNMVFYIVVFSVIIQGMTLKPLARFFNLFEKEKNSDATEIDLEELEELSIKICGDKSLIKEYIRLNRNPTSKIAFSDSRFIKNLIDKGIFINKSLNYSFPDFIPKNLMHHYIRGYFDGDGSVYLSDNKSKFSFTGSHHFIPPLNKYLFDNNIFLKEYAIVDRGNFCSIHIGGILPSRLFYEYIYSDANYYLNRKKDIFDSALCLSDKTNASSKIGEGCDANTEVSLIEGKATVEHS